MTRLYTFAAILFLSLLCCGSINVNAQSPDRAQMLQEMTTLRERLKEIEKQYIPPAPEASEDNFLIKKDKNPNSRGAELIFSDQKGLPVEGILDLARAGQIKFLYIIHSNLVDTFGVEAVKEACISWHAGGRNPVRAFVICRSAWHRGRAR